MAVLSSEITAKLCWECSFRSSAATLIYTGGKQIAGLHADRETRLVEGDRDSHRCLQYCKLCGSRDDAGNAYKKEEEGTTQSMRQTDVLLCSFKEGFCAACFGLAGCEEDRVFELATGDYIAYSLIDIG